MPILNILVTRSTKNQRFAVSGCHDFDPVRFFSARVAVQIFECPNVMHFDLLCERCGSTLFTDLGQKPFLEFRSWVPMRRWSVFEVCLHIPLQRDTAPRGYQRLLPLAWHAHAQPFVGGSLYDKFGFVLVHDFLHRGMMFGR